MDIQKRIRLEQVAVRIDPAIRQQVKELAKEKEVRESDVYRSIITSFFIQTVSNKETDCKQLEYKEGENNDC